MSSKIMSAASSFSLITPAPSLPAPIFRSCQVDIFPWCLRIDRCSSNLSRKSSSSWAYEKNTSTALGVSVLVIAGYLHCDEYQHRPMRNEAEFSQPDHLF